MLQQIINVLYRHPKANLEMYKRFGGYFAYRKMMADKEKMAKASVNLPPVTSHFDGLPVYFLTGKNYLYQTLFCIQSLSKFSDTKFNFTLVDDGSFDGRLIQQISRLLPGATIINAADIEKNLARFNIKESYPDLYAKRNIYPHLKKLTDIHTISGAEWKLVLDSDMLFWDCPTEMIKWLENPAMPIHMRDCVESYGYTQKLMELLSGDKIPELLNVGIIGLESTDINWAELDKWIKELERLEGTSYYLEQALSAMLVGSKTSVVLNEQQYVVNPEKMAGTGDILHHYVDLSKRIYFSEAWKKLLN